MSADNIALDSPSNRLLALPIRQQVLLGAGIVLALVLPFLLTGSLLGYEIVLICIVCLVVVSKPLPSIIVFILFNVLITFTSLGEAERVSIEGVLFGAGILLLLLIWTLRIRVIESQSLSRSRPALFLNLFWVWAAITTCAGLVFGNNILDGLHELHNLSPLFFLPILYEYYVQTDSTSERVLFRSVLVIALVTITWNIIHFRSNVLQSITLNEVGRANTDETLSCLMIFISGSFLMSAQKIKTIVLSSVLFILGLTGLLVSFRRSLYISSVLCVIALLFLGFRGERRRGFVRLSVIMAFTAAAATPIVYSIRVIRLLLMNFGLRFLSSQHVGTDISLLDRYAEWRDALMAILHSPILGYGFGGLLQHLVLENGLTRHQPFMHNSYLYIFFKTGFVGGFLFFVAFGLFLIKGFRLCRSMELNWFHHSLVRAAFVYLILILIGCITDQYLEHRPALVWIGLIWGYFLALEAKLRSNVAPESSEIVMIEPLTFLNK